MIFRKKNSHLGKVIPVRWVRTPIDLVLGRPLRILIYARYSTDEQSRQSINSQIRHCKNFIRRLLAGQNVEVEFITLYDERLSGELVSRPSINKARKLIARGKIDLVLTEDASRLFRDDIECVRFVRQAIDHGTRVLLIGDGIDTAEDGWEDKLKECARYHALHNKYCSQRMRRMQEELWETGAAMGQLRAGYRRIPSIPARDGEPAEGPNFDEIDESWSPYIVELFERIAANESPWSVAEWANSIGLPRPGARKGATWLEDNIKDLVRQTIYRGVEYYRDTVIKKVLMTGAHKQIPNAPDQVWMRDMLHLRIVSDALWYAANEAIDNRRSTKADDSQSRNDGAVRNTDGPLKDFNCQCSQRMHKEGRGKGGYRCKAVKKAQCWNKATCIQEEAHELLRDAIVPRLRISNSQLLALEETAARLLDDQGVQEAERVRLEERQAQLQLAIRNLITSIKTTDDSVPELAKELKEARVELATVKAQLEELVDAMVRRKPATSDEILLNAETILTRISRMDRKSQEPFHLLVGEIVAVPYIQFGGNKVVLRAHFEIRLAACLPRRIRRALTRLYGPEYFRKFECIPMCVNLFDPSTGPKHGLTALALDDQGLGLTAIGKRLGITKRQANIAVQYGKAMQAAGVTDPFTRLTEPPQAGSRWRKRGTGVAYRDRKKRPKPNDDRRKSA